MVRKLASGKKSTDWAIFEKRFELPDYDDPKGIPSRIRWRLIHTPWFGIYLHKWNKPDPRLTAHNHPWAFFSIILKGKYLEYTRIQDIHHSKWVSWFNFCSRKKFHYVTVVEKGTISLMFVGKTHQDWGYMTDDGYVEFNEHEHSVEFIEALKKRNNG